MRQILDSLIQQARQAPDESGVTILYGADGDGAYYSPHDPAATPSPTEVVDIPPLTSVPDLPYRLPYGDGVCLTVLPFRDEERCYIRADRLDSGGFARGRLALFDPSAPDRAVPENFQGPDDRLVDVTLSAPQPAQGERGGFDFHALRDVLYLSGHMIGIHDGDSTEYLADITLVDLDEYHAYAEDEDDDHHGHHELWGHRTPRIEPRILRQVPADFDGPIEYEVDDLMEHSSPAVHASPETLPTIEELSAHFTDDPSSYVVGLDDAGELVELAIEEPFLPELTIPGMALHDDPALVGLANLLCAQALAKGQVVVDRTERQRLQHCYGAQTPDPVEAMPENEEGLTFVVTDDENRRLHDPGAISIALGADDEQHNGRLMFYEMSIRPSDRSSAYRYECADPDNGAVQPSQRRGLILPPMPATT